MNKVFDYAIERDDENVEIRFTDGSRYDMPTAEWQAIVDAAHRGLLTWTAQGDDE